MLRGADAECQDEIRTFLACPEHWDADPSDFSVYDTHISTIYLVGRSAFKMKKSVSLGYLDFTSLEKRRTMLDRELRMNRRNAPHLYKEVLPITAKPGGGYRVGGAGPAVEWLLEMERFDQDALFSVMAEEGRLDIDLAPPLAAKIASMHEQGPRCRSEGWADAFARVLVSNGEQYEKCVAAGVIDEARVALLLDRTWEVFHRHKDFLEKRAHTGWARRCHSDMHLGNIVVINDEPLPFDCIEFNDDFSCVDVLYDLAFLFMDLRFRDLRCFASRLLNEYFANLSQQDFEETLEAMALLPLYVAVRAGVRTHVSLQTAQIMRDMGEHAAAARYQTEARRYVAFALETLTDRTPCFIVIGGLSGSGKSTLARHLAPESRCVAGAVVLRADEVRKRHFGVEMSEHLPDNAYLPEVSDLVFKLMLEEARELLKAGQTVIVDAVFARPAQRLEAERIAAECAVTFWGFWLDAPAEVLEARVAARQDDVSDATVAVLRAQLAYDLGTIDWVRLDASRSADAVLAHTIRHLYRREERLG